MDLWVDAFVIGGYGVGVCSPKNWFLVSRALLLKLRIRFVEEAVGLQRFLARAFANTSSPSTAEVLPSRKLA